MKNTLKIIYNFTIGLAMFLLFGYWWTFFSIIIAAKEKKKVVDVYYCNDIPIKIEKMTFFHDTGVLNFIYRLFNYVPPDNKDRSLPKCKHEEFEVFDNNVEYCLDCGKSKIELNKQHT